MKIVGAAAILAAFFALAGPAVPAEPPQPYEINVILSLSGPAAFLGKDSQVALRLIEAQVNKGGGIHGRPIAFDVADDHSDPQVALQLANQIVAKHPPLFLGPSLSSTCGAIMPTIVASGPVMYCFSPAIDAPAGSFVFESGPSIPDYLAATVRYFRGRGFTRIGLITSTDASGQSGERAVDAAVAAPENKGVTIVDREHFALNDLGVDAQMARIKGSGAQAAIFWTTGTAFGTLLHGASDVGLKIPIGTNVANLNYAQLASYRAFMPEELDMMSPAFAAAADLSRGPVRNSVYAYLNTIGQQNIKPAQGHVTAWDAITFAIDALKKVGLNATSSDVRNYLANLQNVAGVNGMYDFKRIPQRGVGSDWLYTLRWNPQTNSVSVVSRAGGLPMKR